MFSLRPFLDKNLEPGLPAAAFECVCWEGERRERVEPTDQCARAHGGGGALLPFGCVQAREREKERERERKQEAVTVHVL